MGTKRGERYTLKTPPKKKTAVKKGYKMIK